MTARQALKSLCDLGVTYSQRGKGTFVSEIKLEKSFRQVLSFSEEMRATRPLSRTLSFEVVDPTDDVASALRLAPPGLRSRFTNSTFVSIGSAVIRCI